jgi:hypothetical protein
MKLWIALPIAVASALLATASAAVAEESSGAGGTISASVIRSQLQSLGYTAKIDSDKSGDPRVKATVDGFAWDVFFYDCGSGPLEQRGCASFQFYTGYTVPNDFSLQTINKWNTEKRFAKAYTYVKHDRKNDARIEVDVLIAGTLADPAKTFRVYFAKMKTAADAFRKTIGCSAHCSQTPVD